MTASSQPDVSEPNGQQADGGLVNLHEKLAGLLASRGQWREAYDHLRSALDLIYQDCAGRTPAVPEQLRREVDRLRREHAEAHEQSIRDSLTASYNRRYLDQRPAWHDAAVRLDPALERVAAHPEGSRRLLARVQNALDRSHCSLTPLRRHRFRMVA